jgi:hypothetical protein
MFKSGTGSVYSVMALGSVPRDNGKTQPRNGSVPELPKPPNVTRALGNVIYETV